MKNMLTILTAALLAVMCPLSVSAMELPADTGASFADMEIVECDMLSGYAPIICVDENRIYGITPREHYLRFVLRDGIDNDTAVTQVLEVLEEVYPGITERYRAKDYDSPAARLLTNDQGYCEVEDYTDTAGSAEISEQIMQALAAKGLITEFYSWGETVNYVEIQCGFPDGNTADPLAFAEDITEEQTAALQAYLAEHYPAFAVMERTPDEDAFRVAKVRIKTPEDTTFAEKLRICNELAERVGVYGGNFHVDAMMPQEMPGHNALEKPGDVTLDCKIGITDVIALNRNIMTGDPLSDTAKLNADINGNGTPDETDALAILKEIVEITEGFTER